MGSEKYLDPDPVRLKWVFTRKRQLHTWVHTGFEFERYHERYTTNVSPIVLSWEYVKQLTEKNAKFTDPKKIRIRIRTMASERGNN